MRWKFPPFTSYWVSVVTVAVYFLTLTALVYVHETLPSAPAQGKTLGGIDLDTAWADLETVSLSLHMQALWGRETSFHRLLNDRILITLERMKLCGTIYCGGFKPWQTNILQWRLRMI